jgi:hypothetical protein
MSLTLAALPSEFSWLRPAYRPSPQEVDAYTHFIADHENAAISALTDASRRREEAELQLWIWRSETHQRATRAPRRPRLSSTAGN